jgi:ribosomal protein RSM22 (predicted rRNA methylase)
MSKTLEEMAQQYISTIADTHSVKAACEKAFMAGYKAAQEQLADADKVMPDTCEHILDMGKMVDVNGWISVKDRLPTQNGPILMWSRRLEDVPTCAAAGYELWNWSAEYSPHDYRLNGITHWQELPEPPKEEG